MKAYDRVLVKCVVYMVKLKMVFYVLMIYTLLISFNEMLLDMDLFNQCNVMVRMIFTVEWIQPSSRSFPIM